MNGRRGRKMVDSRRVMACGSEQDELPCRSAGTPVGPVLTCSRRFSFLRVSTTLRSTT
ncbi:hypothetical protein BGY98DRAFT_1028811 [Russula aff. rugulosa BPL654]|nr:hypothetical protein BGY98DRAFT_1028811 [Russula aff. rugulosa BPL654]